MIQRIQSVYLVLAAITIGLLLQLPIAQILAGTQEHVFKAMGIYLGETLVVNGIPVFIFILIILVLHIAIIFMYKNRIRQIRFLIFTILITLGLFGMFYYFAHAGFQDEIVSFKVTVAFPIVACIFDYLAIRAIGKDETLVKSADRIR